MKIKKRHLTLLEVMIAMGLAMAILTALSTLHWQMVAIGVKAEQERAQVFNHLLLQHRISSALSHAERPDPKKSAYFYFSESDPYVGLVFSHDHGSDLNKSFSNLVLSRLFVYEHNLYLATLPPPADWTEEQPALLVEKLAEDVTGFEIKFIDSDGQSTSTWPQDKKALPAIAIISMKIKNQFYEQRFVFPFHPKVIEL